MRPEARRQALAILALSDPLAKAAQARSRFADLTDAAIDPAAQITPADPLPGRPPLPRLVPAKSVLWEVVDGPAEWIGTRIRWELKQDEDFAIVLFAHEGWKEPVEFMYHCSTKWATFLVSLKQLVETGTGAPEPYDLKISNWH